MPEAEAARRTVVTCLMLTNGENRLVLFNPSASAVTYSMTDIVNDQLFVSNASLKGHSFQVSALFSTVFRIEASGPLLVDAGVDYPDSSRQAACFRGTKPAN